jgi:CubicO group peptidase (beta-lactamase class C family)
VLSRSAQTENDSDCLSETLRALAGKHRVPGAQLAVHVDGHTRSVAVGEAEYGSGDPVGRDTAFPVGSITKSCTAAVAMVLVADGDLDLDAPVGEYLPELDRDGCAGITPRQLLSHTSGLAAGPDSATGVATRRYVLDHCRQRNLVLPPGTAFSYSNLGYVLVGHLIETITGMSWWEATELILLKPLGILPTFSTAPSSYEPPRPIATGHSVHPVSGRTVPVRQNEPLVEAPTGGLALSAVDLVSLGLLQVGSGVPEVLPARYTEAMRRAVAGADPFGLADGWGLGLALFRAGATEWVGHDGNADGTSCYLRIDPGSGCVVAFASNANTGAYLWRDLLVELGAAGIVVGRHDIEAPVDRSVVPPADCAGTYANGDDEYQVLAREDGQLYLALDGEVTARLAFHDDLTFSLYELASGARMNMGRFHRPPGGGRIDGIHTMGRFARRRVLRIPRARDRAMAERPLSDLSRP